MEGFLWNITKKNKHWLSSISWLLLIILFTYTPLVDEALKMDNAFDKMYRESQSNWIALFVNYGLLLMVAIDYLAASKRPTGKEILLLIAGFFLGMFICAHTNAYNLNKLEGYIKPLSCHQLSYVFHLLFLGILFYLKTKSLEEISENDVLVVNEEL